MTKIKFLAILVLFFNTLVLTSCESDAPVPVNQEETNNETGGENPGGENPGGENPGGENPGNETPVADYWPTTVNNQWKFSGNGLLINIKIIEPVNFGLDIYNKIVSTPRNVIGNKAYNVVSWINKKEGVYTLKVGQEQFQLSSVIGTRSGYEMVILKDNLDVNATWEGSYIQTTTTNVDGASNKTINYLGTILEKDATVLVNNVTYTHVIKVKLNYEILNPNNTVGLREEEYWFAKNIGPIYTKMKYSNDSTVYEDVLTSYTLN